MVLRGLAVGDIFFGYVNSAPQELDRSGDSSLGKTSFTFNDLLADVPKRPKSEAEGLLCPCELEILVLLRALKVHLPS